jgi:hypothetical protein
VFAVKLDVFTETLTELEPDTVPDPGLTDNHEPPGGLVADVAVKLIPEVPPTLIDCATGCVEFPIW